MNQITMQEYAAVPKPKKGNNLPAHGKENASKKAECKGINTINGEVKWEYIGCTGNNMKVRISEHNNSFINPQKVHATKLSEKIWDEREKGGKSNLEWSKLKSIKPRKANQKSCNLCNQETLAIMHRSSISINTREELGGYCPHRRVHLLQNINENKQNLKSIRAENKRKKTENPREYTGHKP